MLKKKDNRKLRNLMKRGLNGKIEYNKFKRTLIKICKG